MGQNVTLKSLMETHGSNAERVFNEIRSLGNYGDVPATYRGGLDVSSASLKEGQAYAAEKHGISTKEAVERGLAVSDDNIKRIEDLVAGDKPK